ncbi:MAG TPA: hypothetical protein VJQ47_13335 [Steroidobacteraceae bacterium]|nr:hypothetical protein [Steroidobacteraceae bacterium]
MSVEQALQQPSGLWRLLVTAEADPGAIARVLERFQNLNVLPRRVMAECGVTGVLYIQVDVAGVAVDCLSLIAAKLGQCPSILAASWHPV